MGVVNEINANSAFNLVVVEVEAELGKNWSYVFIQSDTDVFFVRMYETTGKLNKLGAAHKLPYPFSDLSRPPLPLLSCIIFLSISPTSYQMT